MWDLIVSVPDNCLSFNFIPVSLLIRFSPHGVMLNVLRFLVLFNAAKSWTQN